jgi:hypothetical protein
VSIEVVSAPGGMTAGSWTVMMMSPSAGLQAAERSATDIRPGPAPEIPADRFPDRPCDTTRLPAIGTPAHVTKRRDQRSDVVYAGLPDAVAEIEMARLSNAFSSCCGSTRGIHRSGAMFVSIVIVASTTRRIIPIMLVTSAPT